MADTHEIEYNLVPNIKGKLDLWKHFGLRNQKTDGKIDADVVLCKQCNFVVQLAGGTLNMSTYMNRPHSLLLLGSPVGNKWKADTPVCISRHTGILYCYRHKILVHILILFSILVHSSIGKACWPIPSYFFCTGTHHYWEGMLTYSKLLFLYWYTSLLGRHADLFQVTSSVLVHSFIGKACWPTPGYCTREPLVALNSSICAAPSHQTLEKG